MSVNWFSRGKSQVLFRYLPGTVIDYHRGKIIAKVSEWDSKEVHDVNKMKIIKKIERDIWRFGTRKNGYPNFGEYSRYALLSPKNVDVELFPLLFSCKKCGKAYEFRDPGHIERELGGKLFCNRVTGKNEKCGGKLIQEHFIFIHECGFVDSLKIKGCDKHGKDYMKFDTRGSATASNFRWVCKLCGDREISPVMGWCNNCQKGIKAPVVFSKSQVFNPYFTSLINIPDSQEENIYSDSNYDKMVIATYLELLNPECLDNASDSLEEDEQEKKDRKFYEMLKASGADSKLLEEFEKQYKPGRASEREKVINKIDELVDTEKNSITDIALELYEYCRPHHKLNFISLDNVIKKASDRADPAYHSVKHFPALMRKAGISKSYVVGDLPIITCVYGFSREKTDVDEATINSFPRDVADSEKVPIYINPIETEAILLEIDRYRVIKWLKLNGWVTGDIPAKDDELALKRWFINNVQLNNISTFSEIDETDKITKEVYRLIHSMSHALMKNAAVQTGLDINSLAEILFPSVPAIMIYSNTIQNFQLGGMFTLFENNIYPWIDNSINYVQNCLYDPVCINSEGACHACLHTSEISCIHFNRDLGRELLIGRTNKDGSKIKGFWERSFIKEFDE